MTTAFTIAAEDDGIRLDRWFKRHHPSVPQSMLQKALRKGQVRLDGKKAETSTRLVQGQELSVRDAQLLSVTPPAKKTAPKNKTKELSDIHRRETQRWVLYKDADILVINKPAGLATQGGSKLSDHLDARLSALQFDAKESPRLVHRLDRDTSGVLVLARSAASAARWSKALQGKQVQKIYWALVVGVPDAYEGEIEGALGKSGGDYEKMQLDADGKKAITRYRVLEPLGKRLALVELEPVTGRTHQLRVHMAELGTPILGDGKYGGREAFIDGLDLPRQLHLHARRIVHGALDVTAPLPKHMQDSFRQLGIHR